MDDDPPKGRDIWLGDELTGAEQLIVAIVFVALLGISLGVVFVLNVGNVVGWLVVGVPYGIATLLLSRYARKHEPWRGPAWWLASRARHRLGVATQPTTHRLSKWWWTPGRGGMIIGLVASCFLVGSVIGLQGSHELKQHLDAHGVRSTGTVLGINDDGRGIDSVTLKFTVNGRTTTADTSGDTTGIPSSPRVGDTVPIIYNSMDPTEVQLTSQYNASSDTLGYVFAIGSGIIAVAGFVWWAYRRPRNDE